MEKWAPLVILVLSSIATGISAWGEYVRRRERRDAAQDTDHTDHGERLTALRVDVDRVRGRVHELANQAGVHVARTELRHEEYLRECARFDREIQNLWASVRKRP